MALEKGLFDLGDTSTHTRQTVRVARVFAFLSVFIYGWSAYFDWRNGYELIGGSEAVFALIGPIVIYLSLSRNKAEYTRWYVVGTLFSSVILIAFTQLDAGINLIWLPLIPVIFFYFVSKTWGLIFSVVSLILIVCGFFAWKALNLTDPIAPLELIHVSAAFIVATVFSTLYEKQRKVETGYLVEQSQIDGLTEVLNRKGLELRLEVLLESAETKPFTFILFDIDDFKAINDTYGHHVGDQVLKAVAVAMRCSLRQGDLFGRWGGEEFAALLPATTLPGAEIVAEKLRVNISQAAIPQVGKMTASFGVTVVAPGDSKATLFQRADNALYTAKNTGKNRCVTRLSHPAGLG